MKKQFLFGILAALSLAGAAYLKFGKQSKKQDVVLPLEPIVAPGGVTKYTDDTFPLKLNSGGTKVKQLQGFLNRLLEVNGYSRIDEDGKFGKKTEQACENIFGEKICTEANFNNLKNTLS